MERIDVLPVVGHEVPGFARLVSYTQPAGNDLNRDENTPLFLSHPNWTGDLEAVRNARVSFDADWRTGDDAGKDEKLLRYMLENKHTSPFEAMSFTFEVKAPIFVLRQWHRHRTWSYNEISARYTELDEGFYAPDYDKITTQSKDNKQARTKEQHPLAFTFRSTIIDQSLTAIETYKAMIKEGCPRELARSVLPVSCYSRMFASVDLHNLMHFLRLRLHAHAQYEIMVYAKALLELIKPIVPITADAFEKSLVA